METMEQIITEDNLAMVVPLVALAVTIIGWVTVSLLNIRAANLDRKNNFQLQVYQNLLERNNVLIKIISEYTTSAMSHTNKMAKLLNEYRQYDGLVESNEVIDAKYSLKASWIDAAHELGEKSFEMQRTIEDYMRYLDMNGTDHTRGTVVHNALMEVKKDAYSATEENRKRWRDYEKMDKLTPEAYTEISEATRIDSDTVFEFGMCVEDVLIIIYNDTIPKILNKPPKHLDLADSRRIITSKGIIDNR